MTKISLLRFFLACSALTAVPSGYIQASNDSVSDFSEYTIENYTRRGLTLPAFKRKFNSAGVKSSGKGFSISEDKKATFKEAFKNYVVRYGVVSADANPDLKGTFKRKNLDTKVSNAQELSTQFSFGQRSLFAMTVYNELGRVFGADIKTDLFTPAMTALKDKYKDFVPCLLRPS